MPSFIARSLTVCPVLVCALCLLLTRSASAQQAPSFSSQRGFYEAPVSIALTSDATIYYTLDGSEPSTSNGQRYSAPININGTTVLRAVAVAGNGAQSRVETHTYLYLRDTKNQPRSVAGWPRNNYPLGFLLNGDGSRNFFAGQHDYGMDPDIVAAYGADLDQGLREIPTLSISMPRWAYWEAQNAADPKIMHAASVELLFHDKPADNEQVNAGLEAHSDPQMKRSLRLAFREELYGDAKWETKLLKQFIRNGDTATDKLDRLVLRAGKDRSWAMVHAQGKVAYTRDQFARSTQIDMSGFGVHGAFVHLYINGLYWGLYNAAERADEHFWSTYFPGTDEQFYSVSSGVGRDGNPSLYRRIIGELIRRNLGERDNYNRVADVVDIDAFADYIALAFYVGYADWPHNNYWAGVGGTDPKLRYVVWDAEWSWTPLYGGGDGARVHPNFVRGGQSDWWPEIPAIWRELMASSEFQMAFADRVYKHVSPGGALTDEASRQRWAELNAYIENAVVAESARWGDTAEASGFPTYTRDRDWREQVAYVDSRIQGNADRLLRVLREQGYYPSIDPPTVNLPGGVIPPGQPLELRTGQGEVVFTTDGTDPRLPGGGLNPVAQRAGAGTAFGVVTPLTIKARVQNGSEWSALFEAEYVPTQDFSGLMINEIMYQPQGDADAEYVELHNTGASALPLAGVQFADGIRYDFGLSDVIEAGDYVVLARDAAAFEQAHGFAPFGAFQGRLDNGGELLMLIDQSGTVIDSVKYDDDLPWPVEADSLGPSLELVDPALDNGISTSWLASKVGGSPGQPNAPNQPPVVSLSLSAPEVQPGQAVQITVDATDPDGQVQQVAFFSGTEKLGEADAASFTFDFVAPAVGTYALRAEATDNGGSLGLSGPSTLFAGSSNPCSPQPADLFFNEINYNSAASLASDDWVELYNNTTDRIDLTGWTFKDSHDMSAYVVPAGVFVEPGGYIVLAENLTSFDAAYGAGVERIGGYNGFKLDNGGETIRLYAPTGCLVDELAYDDEDPWTPEADGTGFTLSLARTTYNANLPVNWIASSDIGGTPGALNFPLTTDTETSTVPTDLTLETGYPNPFVHSVTLPYALPEPSDVLLTVYDVLGQRVATLEAGPMPAGRHEATWEAGALAAGTYYVVLETQAGRRTGSVSLVR